MMPYVEFHVASVKFFPGAAKRYQQKCSCGWVGALWPDVIDARLDGVGHEGCVLAEVATDEERR